MKSILLSLLFCLLAAFSNATALEKQVYDIASYDAPSGWDSKAGEGYMSYSKTDGDDFGQIAIYKHRASVGDIQADFDKDWKELVANLRTVSDQEKAKPESANGWTVMSGSGLWKYNGANVASILTVYSNGKVCISVLCNATAQPYLKDYQALLVSLSLDASKVKDKPESNHSIPGLWVDYTTESSGTSNGFPQLTGGYFRREYLFKKDGTYVFRAKDWSVFAADILFVYETGTWKVDGNQITITAKHGTGGWWGKAKSGRTTEWGNFKKGSDYKSESVTYTFDFQYYSGVKETYLIFQNPNRTQRDRGTSGEGKVNRWSYSPKALDKSLIDNPPGFKAPANAEPPSKTGDDVLAGKTWEGTTTEKFTGGKSNYNTGGFFTRQYKFYSDGTYRFLAVDASNYVDTKSLALETGTYSISGNGITMTPSKGTKDEWTKVGKNSNGNSDLTNRKINESWGKKVRSLEWKSEKVSYTFRVEFIKGNNANALILESDGPTEREGKGNTTYYFETPAEKALKLPDGVE